MRQNTRAKTMKINEIIRKLDNGKFRLYSKKGKNLGTYDTRKGAEERERQVQYFKHLGEITADPRIKKTDIGREDWDEYIGLTKKVASIKGYDIHFYANDKDHTHHYLIKDPNSEGFLGELKLDGYRNKYHQSSVFFDPEIQGKGLGLPLYAYVIKKGYTLVSDQYQSLGSREGIWKKLTQQPGIFVYAWDKKYDEFFQWNPEEDLDSEIYYDREKLDKLEADYKANWKELNDKFDADELDQAEYDRRFDLMKDQYTKAQEELKQVQQFSDVRLVAIADKKKVKEDAYNINHNPLKFVEPQFDVEWEEANRYDFLDKLGKDEWIKLAQTGKAVTVDANSVKKIGNTGADGSETFDDLEPEKVARFKKAMKSGTIEMPIVIKMPNGKLDLVAGNTRLIGLINTKGKAKVWYIDASRLVEQDKMGAINLDTALKDTPEVWQRWIMSLPKELAQEFVDERPAPDQEDIDAFARLKLTSRNPVTVSTKELLTKPWMKGTISRTPQPVVDAINKRYGTTFKGGVVYDRNPDRFFKYAQMPANTAKPSVMVNGDVIFGVGRLVAALLRGDKDVKVWDLKEGVQEAGSKDNYGIPDGATLAQLDKIAKTSTNPEKRERAHWLRNMRRGKNKASK